MTRPEALAEARRRWGRYAWVTAHRTRARSGGPGLLFVGATRMSDGVIVRGWGDTWEAAIADAESGRGWVRLER